MIGYDRSLRWSVEKGKAAVLYPGGLHVLLTGPSGGGGGEIFFAEVMHQFAMAQQTQRQIPLVYFNCAEYAHNPELLSSHLFGHKQGAFTGAIESKRGQIEQVDRGFLLLDEVHRLPYEGQEKLFSILDKGEYRPLGSSDKARPISVRLICATTESPDSTLLRTFMQHELVERARQTNVLTKRDITKAWFIYWLGAEVSNSYERLQSLIFCTSMTPIIKKLYPQKEEQVEALKRHLNFFNSEQTFGAVIQGVAIAMGEQKTRGEPISDSSITGLKTGLMGSLAGIGDSVVWATIMPVVLYTCIIIAISYGLAHKGYTLGRESIIGLLQGGKIKELVYGANVLGLIMMGALSASYVKITSPLKISALEGSEVVVQQILDSIAPGLLPRAAVFSIYFYLVKKGPRYTTILLSVVVLSVVCSLLGIL